MCMKRMICTAAILALLAAGGIVSAQNDKATTPAGQTAAQPKCPVMADEPVNFAMSAESPEGPVFFCCKDCIPKYLKDPNKFTAKVAAQRKILADRPKIQVSCPACNDPVDGKVFLENGGQKIYFSSPECMAKYKSEPGKYASGLANSYTYQTKCPVMDEEIDPKSFATLAGGGRVYFCCKGCDKKLFAEPAKYVPKLAAQGFLFEPKDLAKAASKEELPKDHK